LDFFRIFPHRQNVTGHEKRRKPMLHNAFLCRPPFYGFPVG
jgi:hypothetical protein